jgi:phage repressor protein C with HTH and peptisase S24 domain
METISPLAARIKGLRTDKSLSQQAFADLMGVSRSYLANVETGGKEPSFSFASSLMETFGVEPNWFFHGEESSKMDPSFVTVPKYTVSTSAGNGGSFVAEPLEVSYYAFNLQWIKRRGLDPSQLHIVTVKGDSMEPTLQHGDLILVDRAQATPSDGSTYVVRIWDELVVKHVQRIGPQAISLLSANKVYPPRELELPLDDRNFEIIGRVVASMHEWS